MNLCFTNKYEKAFALAYVNFLIFALISGLLLIQIILNSNLNLFKEYEIQINNILEAEFSKNILNQELKILDKYLKDNKITKNFDFFDSDINKNKIFSKNNIDNKDISISGYRLYYNDKFSNFHDYIKNRLLNYSASNIELVFYKFVSINNKVYSIQATIVYKVPLSKEAKDLTALKIKEIRIIKK